MKIEDTAHIRETRSFSAPDLSRLLALVSEAPGRSPVANGTTTYDNVYEVGRDQLLFTGDFLDEQGARIVRGILLDRWPEGLSLERERLVPTRLFYHDHSNLLYHCALAHLENLPLAFHGHTGVGKTELVRYFASLLRAPVYRMNLHGLSTTDDIIGKLLPTGQGKVSFQDGLVTTAVRNGGILLLEEMNATGQEVWFSLHGLLDGSRALVLVEKDNEVVVQNDRCRIYATFNPAEYSTLYPGTKELSVAYLRRWTSIRVGFTDPEIEKAILLKLYPEFETGNNRDYLEIMLQVAHVARRLLEDRTRSFDFVMGIGVLVSWAGLTLYLGPLQAARVAFYDMQSDRLKAMFRDQIFSYLTNWDIEQLDTPR